MKRKIYPNSILAALTIVILAGCVPADQTIAVVDGQRVKTSGEIQRVREKNRQLLQDRSHLESQLTNLEAKRNSLESSDPSGNRSEIAKLNSEIASLEHKLANMQ